MVAWHVPAIGHAIKTEHASLEPNSLIFLGGGGVLLFCIQNFKEVRFF